jgi:hypothetical protein
MQIEIRKGPIIESIFGAVFNNSDKHSQLSSRERLQAISSAGKIADGLLAGDPSAKLEFTVSAGSVPFQE